MHILVQFGVALFLLSPWIVAHLGWRRFSSFCIAAAILLLLTCVGKFLLMQVYAKNFIAYPLDLSAEGGLSQVLRFFWFFPDSTPSYVRYGRWDTGAWEYIGFVSKITLFTVPGLLILLLSERRRGTWVKVVLFGSLSLLVLIWAVGKGANASLPVLRAYHLPIRLLGGFIPVFIIVTGVALDRLRHLEPLAVPMIRIGNKMLYLAGCSLLVGEFALYTQFFSDKLEPDFFYNPSIYTGIKAQGGLPEVRKIVAKPGKDIEVAAAGSSNIACYEPVFGYRHEVYRHKLRLGPTDQITEGKFNLTHPGCFVAPEYFHCKAWDRISEKDRDNFNKFIKGLTPGWGIPPWQSFLIHLNFGIIFLAILLSLIPLRFPKSLFHIRARMPQTAVESL
jgi:hypothetical protein